MIIATMVIVYALSAVICMAGVSLKKREDPAGEAQKPHIERIVHVFFPFINTVLALVILFDWMNFYTRKK